MDTRIIATLTVLAVSIPIYIVWLVGLILAIVNWKKMPKASLLTVIAIVILFLAGVAGQVFSLNYPIMAHESGLSYAKIGLVTAIVGIANVLLTTACWGMLLAAIFGRRNLAV
jgi:hypothetical protein